MRRRGLLAGAFGLVAAGAARPGDAAAAATTIRIGGSDLNGLVPLWEADFAAAHPGIGFANRLVSGDAAIGALEAGAADIVANGREPVLTEYLAFAEVFGNDGPFQVTVATGSHDKLGRTWAPVIFVNAANPLARLTMAELEGVFGGVRTGGYDGYRWTTAKAMPADRAIRRWGQLGLGGEWRDRPIRTYGYAPTGMSNFFEQAVFHGGAAWAPDYRQYIETTAKQATDHAGTIDRMMAELEEDPAGIAWAGLAHAVGHPRVRPIALGRTAAGPFMACDRASVAARAYPLTRSIFIQLNRPPGTAIAAPVRAFLDHVLGPAGQAVVRRHDQYLPLPPAFAAAERQRLA